MNQLIPYLCAKDALAALAFYEAAFGAEVVSRYIEPSGKLGFADIRLGAARWFLGDEYPALGVAAPGETASVTLVLTSADPEALVARAMAAGAHVITPLEQQQDGARRARLRDPFGQRWIISDPG